MRTTDIHPSLTALFAELIDGADERGEAYVLNPGDSGLLGSLDRLSAADASRARDGGATIAAHVRHVRYGLSLFNRWAAEGGNPFADARWDEAWKTTAVGEDEWRAIRDELREDARRWREALGTSREVGDVELTGMLASIVHVGYHLGAIRQIAATTRGPREGSRA